MQCKVSLLYAMTDRRDFLATLAAPSAVIRRTIEAPGTFDTQGWLTIGFCGHQPRVGEYYISTGSVYP